MTLNFQVYIPNVRNEEHLENLVTMIKYAVGVIPEVEEVTYSGKVPGSGSGFSEGRKHGKM